MEEKSRWSIRAEYLHSNERCERCGKQDAFTLIGKPRCADCVERDKKRQQKYNKAHADEINKKMKNRYQRLKDEGICVACGKKKAREGRIHCKACAVKTSNYRKQQAIKKMLEELNDGGC